MNDLYAALEEIELFDFFSTMDISQGKFFNTILEYTRNSTLEKNVLDKCQLEIDIINFYISQNKISYRTSGTYASGEPYEYPNFKKFQENEFNYLIERLINTNNLYLCARYSHLLCHSPKKHLKYATIASKAYYNISKILFDNIDVIGVIDRNTIMSYIIDSIENAVLIAEKFKIYEEINRSKQFILGLIRDSNLPERNFISATLISFMLDNNSIFKLEDFENLDSQLFAIAKTEVNQVKIYTLNIGKKVSQKLKNNINIWNEELGQYYERLSLLHRNMQNDLGNMQYVIYAIKYYKKAKNNNKVDLLNNRYKEIKKKIKFQKFTTPINLKKEIEFINGFSEKISKCDSFFIITALKYDPRILPTYDYLEKWALLEKKANPLVFLSGISFIDELGNVSENFISETELTNYTILQLFDFQLRAKVDLLLIQIILKSILRGNFTARSVIEYIRNHTWLGAEIEVNSESTLVQKYSWVEFIAPSINFYLTQISFSLQNENNYHNLILCIESLTLKIEGIFRDICNLKGGTSSYLTVDKKNQSDVVRERDLNALLYDEVIINHFSKDDLLFFRFLLIEKSGLNLRNKIAHSLIKDTRSYSIEIMNLLLLAIFRLTKEEYAPFSK